MTRRLVIPPEIVADVQAIQGWWRTNRPLAPNLFIDEFNYACEMLLGMPGSGDPTPTLTSRRPGACCSELPAITSTIGNTEMTSS
jgi:hypothetical protein